MLHNATREFGEVPAIRDATVAAKVGRGTGSLVSVSSPKASPGDAGPRYTLAKVQFRNRDFYLQRPETRRGTRT